MIKLKTKKIKFNPDFVWQLNVIVFLSVFMAILLLSINDLNVLKISKVKIDEQVKLSSITIKNDIFDKVLLNTKERKEEFEKIFLNKPFIKNPSSI